MGKDKEKAMQQDDWRLCWYNGELDGKTFEYKRFVTQGSNDHEHCVFCMQKITDLDIPDVEREGYCALNSERNTEYWVCKECFDDFAEKFDFRIKANN